MPVTPSARLGLHAPSGSDPADIPADLLRLRDQIDDSVACFSHGLTRPAAGTAGRIHFDAALGELSYDDGRVWRSVYQPEARRIYVGEDGAPSYGATWSTSADCPVRFWKTGPTVHIFGIATRSDTVFSPTVFALPVGYRPAATISQNPIVMSNSVYDHTGAIYVLATGAVNRGNVGPMANFLMIDVSFQAAG
jgi:hypothetical protein